MRIREATYHKRIAKFEAYHQKIKTRFNRIGTLRSITFVLCVGGFFMGMNYSPHFLFYGISLIALGVFIAGVLIHRKQSAIIQKLETLLAINQEGVARLQGRWGDFAVTGEKFLSLDRPEMSDLNILGKDSLFQMIQQTMTPRGEEKLAERLGGFTDIPTTLARQEAIKELSPRLSMRQHLLAEGRLHGKSLNPDPFLKWMKSPSYLIDRKGLMLLHRILVPTTVLLILVDVLSMLPSFWIIGIMIQMVVFFVTGERGRQHYLPALNQDAEFLAYRSIFRLLERQTFKSEYLRSLHSRLIYADKRLSVRMEEFEKINGALCLHYSILYPFINLLLLWDLHYLYRLEKWKELLKPRIEDSFEALAEIEALASLAGFAHDHPDYAYPKIDPGAVPLSAKDLGHPLIPEKERVYNDFEIPTEGHLSLVTGSNMSGKSTFVRTVGINMALVFSGAPVVARTYSARPCQVVTCIQAIDSIRLHVSHFYSEVKAIKGILDAVSIGKLPVLYLIDELFAGTNTKERLLASRGLILRLAGSKSYGLITTHDLELVTLSDQSDTIRNVHFKDEITPDDKMTFSYRLHEGPVSSTNALELLKREGIEF